VTLSQYWQNQNFQIFLVIAGLFLVSYAVGLLWNKRLREIYLTYLRYALREHCSKLKIRSVGSTGYVLNCTATQSPWRDVEISVLLQPREIVLFWLANALLGRGDRLAIRANRRQSPGYNLALTAKGQKPAALLSEKRWLPAGEVDGLLVYITADGDKGYLAEWGAFRLAARPALQQLVVQQQKVHLRALLWANKLSPEQLGHVVQVFLTGEVQPPV